MVQTCKLRTLPDIQTAATCGVMGKVPNKLCSFESLTHEQLRQELVSMQIYDFPPNNKKSMTDILKDHLCGVQRVPALLLLNPAADLWDMNLLDYTVLSFEPLHDLKSHIATREPLKYGIRNSGITEYGIAEYGIRNNGIWKAACTTPASSHREDETAPHLTKMLAYERKTIGT